MSLGTATRGCGKRVKGAVYCETLLGAGGRPIEDFIVDPPAKVDEAALGLSNIGVKLVMGTHGVWNVLDIVGQESYPNVADFVEEVRRFGVSRRLPKTLDFAKLTSESRLILLHRRAFIENFDAFYRELLGDWSCPKGLLAHDIAHPATRDNFVPDQMCAGLWWQDVEGEQITRLSEMRAADSRYIRRHMPSFNYDARTRPDSVAPTYSLAIFAAFPIHNLAVVRDPDGGSDEEAMRSASKSNLPVNLENE